jgi:TPR repeat protein
LKESPAREFPKVTELRPVEKTFRPVAESSAIAEPAARESDLEWLREKSLSRLSDADEPSGKWKYALLALALVAFAFAILQWLSNQPATLAPHSTASGQPAATQPASEPSVPAEKPTLTQENPPIAAPRQSQPTGNTHSGSSSAKLANSSAGSAVDNRAQASRPAAPIGEGGAQELNLAQGYLEGKHGARDSAEAAKWLWKAVAKENGMADVLLADLYLSGDGVSKSCAQARLLLVAAVKKGEPAAAGKLRGLESGGCR